VADAFTRAGKRVGSEPSVDKERFLLVLDLDPIVACAPLEGPPPPYGLLAQILQLRVADRSELLRVGLGSPSRNCPPKMPEMEPAMSLHTFVPQAT
jgi:hypothetical protein